MLPKARTRTDFNQCISALGGSCERGSINRLPPFGGNEMKELLSQIKPKAKRDLAHSRALGSHRWGSRISSI